MSDEVKPGQVWASKNSGNRIVIGFPRHSDRKEWQWVPDDNRSAPAHIIAEWMLLEDYVLVKEAP